MGNKKFKLKKNNKIEKCPKCGNNTEFIAKSEYCAEDCCSVWVECKCGYDASNNNDSERFESVYGSLDNESLLIALDCWNDSILSNRSKLE